jgi:ketosteroid isomerase-like protein
VNDPGNVEVVRSFLDAFQRGDQGALLARVDPAVEVHEWPQGPEARTYRGPDGLREALADWSESWERIDVEVLEITADGDRAVATMRQRYRGRGSELETEIVSANVFTVRDSKIVKIEFFTDQEARSVR